MVIISSSVVGLKKIDSRNDPDRKSLCEQGGGCIFFARLGPILELVAAKPTCIILLLPLDQKSPDRIT